MGSDVDGVWIRQNANDVMPFVSIVGRARRLTERLVNLGRRTGV